MSKSTTTITLDGNHLNLEKIQLIANGAKIEISPSCKKNLEKSSQLVKKVADGSTPVYGINTGFGFFANKQISKKKLIELQTNILKSHAAGYGPPLTIPETRLAMALRLNVLLKGFTGVHYALCEAIRNLIEAEIYPIIPEYGSVGASGDLIPLAHLALPIIGEGLVFYRDEMMTAKDALKKAKLKPYQLSEKEGLSLVNGTQIMLAVGGLALAQANSILSKANKIAALTFEAFHGIPSALNGLIHEARGHKGQIECAESILKELEGSYLFKKKPKQVQDPYSLRCAPQIHGPSSETLNFASRIIETELNAATDNPLIFSKENLILGGGNFHGQYLAMAFDISAIALSEIANVSDRRLELLMNPHMSRLPAFLSPEQGTCSGYMALQYLTASLVNENKLLANPSCTDSIPGNVGVEDHVSMGMTSARKLKKIVQNTCTVLVAEMIAAAQGIEMRKAKPLGRGTKNSYMCIRKLIPPLTQDRIVSIDIGKGLELFYGGF